MTDQTRDNPGGWAGRLFRRDGGRAPGTDGARTGTSGVWRSGWAWLAVLALVGLNTVVNIMTSLDDARLHGVDLPVWRITTLEVTSAVAATVAAFTVLAAVRLAPPTRGPLWRTLAVHAAGTFVYSGVHMTLMILFRIMAFAALGRPFAWRLAQAPYEYRKDLIAYFVIAALFWMLTRGPSPPPAAPQSREAGPLTFDIRDGASILRVPVREILAAKAAGNYVEFALEDGRRPLMRGSMAGIETALSDSGFVRTHRSWLVNAERVRALSAAGSGDFRVDLGGGVTAPVSRRFPAALARLSGEAKPQV